MERSTFPSPFCFFGTVLGVYDPQNRSEKVLVGVVG
jgi:hypothetical protein